MNWNDVGIYQYGVGPRVQQANVQEPVPEGFCTKHPQMKISNACHSKICFQKNSSISNGIFCVTCAQVNHNDSSRCPKSVKSFEDINANPNFFPGYEIRKQKLLEKFTQRENKAMFQLAEFRKLTERAFDRMINALQEKKEEIISEFAQLPTTTISFDKFKNTSSGKYRNLQETVGAINYSKKEVNAYNFHIQADFNSKVWDSVRLNGSEEEYENEMKLIDEKLNEKFEMMKERIARFHTNSVEQIKRIKLDRLLEYAKDDPYHILLDDYYTAGLKSNSGNFDRNDR